MSVMIPTIAPPVVYREILASQYGKHPVLYGIRLVVSMLQSRQIPLFLEVVVVRVIISNEVEGTPLGSTFPLSPRDMISYIIDF